MSKTIVAIDLFCGAGGSSSGLAEACHERGLRLDLTAINHWDRAIETHSANHPDARHLCNGLDDLDPTKLFRSRRIDLLIASPECTHHSTARGGKPMNDQSRATAWHVVRWAEALRPAFVLVENVREFTTWGPLGTNGRPLKRRRGETFDAWLRALRAVGYTVDWRLLNAADYGAATSRTRLFVMARRGKGRIPWPEPTHARQPVEDLFGRRERWRAAREVIDWSLPCPSIFSRKRPLSANTLRRIEAGLRRFGGQAAEPFLVLLRGTAAGQVSSSARSADDPVPTLSAGGEHVGLVRPFVLGQQSGGAPREADGPLPTVATDGAISLVQPFVLGLTHGGRERSPDDPLPTVTGANRGELGVVQPFILDQHSAHGPRSGGEPVPTITTTSRGIGVVQPFLVPTNYGERPGQTPRTHSVDDPGPTVVGTVTHGLCRPFLVPYYGTGQADDTADPVRTLTARDRLGLVLPDGVRIDIGFRMLQPHELAAGMGFARGYRFCGNRSDVVKQIGNAVEVRKARALCAAILAAA